MTTTQTTRAGRKALQLLAVLLAVYVGSTRAEPPGEFDGLEGFRLAFKFLNVPGGDKECSFSAGPMEAATFVSDSHFFLLAPKEIALKCTGLEIKGKTHPVRLQASDDDTWTTVTIVLEREPAEIAALRKRTDAGDGFSYQSVNLDIDIEQAFELEAQSQGIIFRFEN